MAKIHSINQEHKLIQKQNQFTPHIIHVDHDHRKIPSLRVGCPDNHHLTQVNQDSKKSKLTNCVQSVNQSIIAIIRGNNC